jgi:FHA domain
MPGSAYGKCIGVQTAMDEIIGPYMVVVSPSQLSGLVLPLSAPEAVVGNSDTADVVLDDVFVSRRHALVTVDESGVATIRDLNSTGGTFVNDERLDGPHVLRAGDSVRFADLEARFEPGPRPGLPATGTAEAPTLVEPRMSEQVTQRNDKGASEAMPLRMALMVDRGGVLNAATLDTSTTGGWQGPDAIGTASLVPGSPVTVFQHSTTVFTALMVDRDGVLNAATLDTSTTGGWQGPDAIGTASLVPGSLIAVVEQSETVFTALMVDRDGILNAATLNTGTGGGWRGPEAIGTAVLIPGSEVATLG